MEVMNVPAVSVTLMALVSVLTFPPGETLSIPLKPLNGSVLPNLESLGHNRMRRKAPSVPTAPLDPNDNIHHVLDELNSILGSVGGAGSGLVMGLTGISITDCGLSVKEEDLSTISCAQFLDTISNCDSLSHIKPLIQQASNKYKKKPNSRAPCFSKKGGRKGQKKRN